MSNYKVTVSTFKTVCMKEKLNDIFFKKTIEWWENKHQNS